jgi:cytochrome c oxidase assembly protein subunit 15
LVAIHWTHRTFAFLVIALVAFVAHKALRIAELRPVARGLLVVIALQFCTGLATVFFEWPLALAVAHNGGAALLVILLTMLNYKLRLAAESRVAQRDVSLAV